jgi:hypothetical protein
VSKEARIIIHHPKGEKVILFVFKNLLVHEFFLKKIHNLFNMNSQIKLTLTEKSIGMSDLRDNILVTLAYGRTRMNEKSYKIVLKGERDNPN